MIYTYHADTESETVSQELTVEIHADNDGNNPVIALVVVNVVAPVGWLDDWKNAASVNEWAAQAYFENHSSEPEPNQQTGWVSKTPEEARAEFQSGWNLAEAERKATAPVASEPATIDLQAAARKRHGLATSGVLRIEKGDFSEWDIISGSGDEDDDGTYTVATCYNLGDAEFFAHAHDDVAALLTEIEHLKAAKAELEAANNALNEKYKNVTQDWLLTIRRGSRLVVRASEVLDYDIDPETDSDNVKRLRRAVKLYRMSKKQLAARSGANS